MEIVGVKLMRVRWWFDPVIIPPNNTNNTILENSDLSLSFKLLQLIILFVHMIMNNNYKKNDNVSLDVIVYLVLWIVLFINFQLL